MADLSEPDVDAAEPRPTGRVTTTQPFAGYRVRRGRVAAVVACLAGLGGLAVWAALGLGQAGSLAQAAFAATLLWLVGLGGAWMRYRASAFLVASAVGVVLLGGLEVGLRYLIPGPHAQADLTPLLRFDDRLGWRLRPQAEAVLRSPAEYAVRVRTDAEGYRRAPPRAEGATPTPPYRVALLGDDPVAGFGVEDHRLFGHVLDRALGPPVEVRSYGVPGYGQLQELLLLQEVLTSYSPQLVLVLVSLPGDLDDNLGRGEFAGHERPRFRLVEGRALEVLPGLQPPPPRPAAVSDLAVARLLGAAGGGEAPAEVRYAAKEPDGEASEATAKTRLFLRRMALACEARGAGLALVLVPSRRQVELDAPGWEALLAEHGLDPAACDRRAAQHAVVGFAARERLPCLDLLPHLEARRDEGEALYYAWDDGWTVAGHRRAAEAVTDWLRKRRFVPVE